MTLIVFFALSGVFAEVSRRYHQSFDVIHSVSAPFAHRGNDNIPATVFDPGETVYVHYESRIETACRKVTIQTKLLKPAAPKPGMVASLDVLHSFAPSFGTIEPGIYEINEILSIPVYIPDGKYLLRRYNFLECGGFEWTEVYDAIRIEIRKGALSTPSPAAVE